MTSCAPDVNEPRHSIAKAANGWQLVIQNEHCSVMQVFRSEDTARQAVDRMMEFFQTMSPQPPTADRAA
jgi:hypothetical protein